MLREWLTTIRAAVGRLRVRRFPLPRPPVRAELPKPVGCRLERVVVADGVMQTLFEDYAEHRRTLRGNEEIGWILLGVWQNGEAVALAAIPAGAEREASASHVRFNADAQGLVSRMLRQQDKRLTIIGVVHTHPGAMRYPSEGDLLGDTRWVSHLRAREAVFAIGTADGAREDAGEANLFSDLCFSWYTLAAGDQRYRPLPVVVQAGADLALPVRPVWSLIEAHAAPLNRLCQQLADVQMEVIDEGASKFLAVKIGLADRHQKLRLLLGEAGARYYWDRQGELISIEPREPDIERAVYLILAELAKDAPRSNWEARTLVES